MEIRVRAGDLRHALSVIGKAVPEQGMMCISSGNIYIQDYIHIEAWEDNLYLAADNGEVGIHVCLIAHIIKPGGCLAVPAKLLGDFVRRMDPKDSIHMSFGETTLEIRCLHYKAKIRGTQRTPDETHSDTVEGESVEISSDDLETMIDQVEFSALPERGQLMSCVKVGIENDMLTMAATDGYRLSVRTHKIASGMEDAKFILPAHGMRELSRVCGQMDSNVIITPLSVRNRICAEFSHNQAIQSVRVYISIGGNRFVQYESIVPTRSKAVATVSVTDFLNAVRTAAPFAKDGRIHVSLNGDTDGLCIEAQSATVGNNSISVPILAHEIEDGHMDFYIDCRYLIEALKHASDSAIEIRATGSQDPIVLSAADDDSYIHLIMPLES